MTSRSGRPRILRDSLRSFWSSSVSSDPSSTMDPASGTTLNAIGATYFTGAGNCTDDPSYTSFSRVDGDAADLRRQLFDACQAATGDRLVRRDDQAAQTGRVVQRLSTGHRGHRRAVRVGDDALGGLCASSPLTSDTTSGTSGSCATPTSCR